MNDPGGYYSAPPAAIPLPTAERSMSALVGILRRKEGIANSRHGGTSEQWQSLQFDLIACLVLSVLRIEQRIEGVKP